MGLTLTVLGCSGTYAGPGNACSGYLLRTSATTVWLDCGPGTLANVQDHVSLADVDALVISHSHPDHWLELPILRNALKFHFAREGFPVHGTVETLELAEPLCSHEVSPTFDWTVITDGSVLRIADLTMSFARTDHPVETLAVRIDVAGRSLAFSADTGSGWSARTLADVGLRRPLDVFLCEATLDTDQADSVQHLTAAQAGKMATEAGVGRLLLTHLAPGSDPGQRRAEAAASFGGPVEVATVGTTYTI